MLRRNGRRNVSGILKGRLGTCTECLEEIMHTIVGGKCVGASYDLERMQMRMS